MTSNSEQREVVNDSSSETEKERTKKRRGGGSLSPPARSTSFAPVPAVFIATGIGLHSRCPHPRRAGGWWVHCVGRSCAMVGVMASGGQWWAVGRPWWAATCCCP